MRLRGEHRSTAEGRAQPGPSAAPQEPANRLHLLTEAARAITADLPEDELLQCVADIARDVVGAHQSVISLTVGDKAAQLISAISLSDKDAAWRRYDEKPDGSGIYALVVRHGKSMRMTQAELEAHPAYKAFGAAGATHPPMRGWLAAPLIGADGGPIGLIQLSDKYDGDFTAEDEQLVTQLAQLAVLAIDRARVRQHAAESLVLLEAVQTAAPVGFAVLDKDLRYVRVNQALAEMNGVPAEEHVGRTISEVVPNLSPGVEEALRDVLASDAPASSLEVSGTTDATGTETRHWLVSYYSVEVAGERALGCVILDVTDQRIATQGLVRSEQRYRTLVETTQDMVWTVGVDGCFDFVSGAVQEIYGYGAAELIGRPFVQFLTPERQEENLERFSRVMRGERDVALLEGETQLLRKDGSATIVEYRAVPLTDDHGNVVAITGASTDVTERRRSEAALRASEERFRSLFESAAVGMALTDVNGNFVQVNGAFCRLLRQARGGRSSATHRMGR
jgi:PAS domain S-box-containing protein